MSTIKNKPNPDSYLSTQWLKVLDNMFNRAKELGLLQLTAENHSIDDARIWTLNGKKVISFGSCAYSGLELDPRLKAGVVDATQRFGTQFPSSRAYVSAPLYREFENLVEQIFRAPIAISSTVTLGHAAALPILIQRGDAVLYDIQVHASVQAVFPTLYIAGISCVAVNHNRMDELEQRVSELISKHKKVWYLCDGIYSMHGDFAPLEALRSLVERYEQLHLYIDDAHAISWMGQHGSGSIMGSTNPIRTRTVVTASFSKSFCAAGGAIIFPDENIKRLVRNCGNTMIFSGPIQPPNLGACIASAKIHLTDEIKQIQSEVRERIHLFNKLCDEYQLPLCSKDATPIRFLHVGSEDETFKIAKKIFDAGFYINVSTYPAVPRDASGIRIPLTRHQTLDDIKNLLAIIAEIFPRHLR